MALPPETQTNETLNQPMSFGADDDPTALPHTRIFTALLTDLQRSARRLARGGEDADDLVQDTLLRVWSRMAMISDGHPDAAPIEDLRAYAFATLRHRAFARYSIARPVDDEAQAEAVAAPRGSDGATRLACAEALEALGDLPDEQQELLRLRAMDGLSYAEIARKTGLPLGTVTSRLARGRATLRQVLDLPPGAPVTDLLGGPPG
jgi:RNA polymerase sigma-70 factor (ECF subfamily)